MYVCTYKFQLFNVCMDTVLRRDGFLPENKDKKLVNTVNGYLRVH